MQGALEKMENKKDDERRVIFKDNGIVRWEGFTSKSELFDWMYENIFKDDENVIFNKIQSKVIGLFPSDDGPRFDA
jgi:hypothetical protein